MNYSKKKYDLTLIFNFSNKMIFLIIIFMVKNPKRKTLKTISFHFTPTNFEQLQLIFMIKYNQINVIFSLKVKETIFQKSITKFHGRLLLWLIKEKKMTIYHTPNYPPPPNTSSHKKLTIFFIFFIKINLSPPPLLTPYQPPIPTTPIPN